jgi:hypothetical protein
MIPNINPTTNIAYGVIQGNNAPSLLDDIFTHGNDDSFEAAKKEKVNEILALLEDGDEDMLAKFIDENTSHYVDDCMVEAKKILSEQGDDTPTEADADQIFDEYNVSENWESDESNYSWDDGKGNKFLVTYLGGAPLIYCIETTCVVQVKSLCSPCVPNAGDLDSGLVESGGFECYGIPLSLRDEEADRHDPEED